MFNNLQAIVLLLLLTACGTKQPVDDLLVAIVTSDGGETIIIYDSVTNGMIQKA